MKKLSVIIAAYNEGKTIAQVLRRTDDAGLPHDLAKEIIVVNDHSSDDTEAQVKKFLRQGSRSEVKYIRHGRNEGKGAAVQTGIRHATGDFMVIQDADMEYDPREYTTLLQPVLEGRADAVFGSRFIGGKAHRVLFFWHRAGNRFLTLLSNLFTNLNLTDMECGFKLFKADVLKSLLLREKRFGFEPEVTAKLSRLKGIRIYEVGISYYGRTYKEGKKINWKDGFRAVYCILKYNLFYRRGKNTSNLVVENNVHVGRAVQTAASQTAK